MQNRNGISQNSFSSVSPLMFVSLCTYHFFTEKLFSIALNGLSNATQSKAIKQKCSQRKFVHRMNWADTHIHIHKRNTRRREKSLSLAIWRNGCFEMNEEGIFGQDVAFNRRIQSHTHKTNFPLKFKIHFGGNFKDERTQLFAIRMFRYRSFDSFVF